MHFYGAVSYSKKYHETHNNDFNDIYNLLRFDDISYEKQLLTHLRTMSNAFTMLCGVTDTHAVSVFLHKYKNELYIFILDNNYCEDEDVMDLCAALEKYYRLKLGIYCQYIYIADYSLNFGAGAGDEFLEQGYCVLVSHLLMDIMYTNMVVYKNISCNTSPTSIVSYIETMQKYIYNVFVKTNKWRHFVTNYAYKVFGDMGFFYDDETKPVPHYFKVISLKNLFNYKKPQQQKEQKTWYSRVKNLFYNKNQIQNQNQTHFKYHLLH